MKRRAFLAAVLTVLVVSAVEAGDKAIARDQAWASPISLAGVPNLYRVSPNIYRSAQPTPEGFKALEQQLGIKPVLSLREFHEDRASAKGTKLNLQSVPMFTFSFTTEEVIGVLKIIMTSSKAQPILVHCQHGADRTGVVIAMYRIVVQGWSKEQAIAELENGGYGFHSIFFNIPSFIRNANIAAYAQALAISP